MLVGDGCESCSSFKMHCAANKTQPRFIIEGLLTIAVAAVAYFLIHDAPEKATFLTDDEKSAVLQSLHAQFLPEDHAMSENDSLKWHYVGLAFKDWKLWLGLFVSRSKPRSTNTCADDYFSRILECQLLFTACLSFYLLLSTSSDTRVRR